MRSRKRTQLRGRPTIADYAKAFGSIDAMLDKLSQGWIHAAQGQPVFRNPADGVWYDIPAAMEGWIDVWARLCRHYGLELDLDPLARLSIRLRYGTPIGPEDVERAVAVVIACKRSYRRMDMAEVRGVANTVLIANKVEELGLIEMRERQ